MIAAEAEIQLHFQGNFLKPDRLLTTMRQIYKKCKVQNKTFF